jgi:hypothetical protein
MDGEVEWMSEFGLLAGEYWNLVPFYALLTGVYGLVGITWIIYMHKYSGDLISLQYYMFVVLIFNFVETSLCLANLYTANASGRSLNAGSWWVVSETARVVAETMCRTFLYVDMFFYLCRISFHFFTLLADCCSASVWASSRIG